MFFQQLYLQKSNNTHFEKGTSESPPLLKLWKDRALKGDCLHCQQKKISHLSLPCVVTASVRKLEGKTSCAQLVRKESQGYSNRFYAIMTIRISVRSPNCCCTRAIMIVKVWFCDFKNIIEWNHWPLWPRGEDTGRLTAIHMARLWLGWKRNTGIAYCHKKQSTLYSVVPGRGVFVARQSERGSECCDPREQDRDRERTPEVDRRCWKY